ncbi:hypothetical protein Dda_6852 [Drechslerella dactyloides]|uniref:Uncharacterized protein n=1 Tax=Drechslerella dactyloides TaxID=74499 RepID=A0AAD6IU98_DREDA|nr:hypothetical protein Dda_6852 [Drechslerella dactyloides]
MGPVERNSAGNCRLRHGPGREKGPSMVFHVRGSSVPSGIQALARGRHAKVGWATRRTGREGTRRTDLEERTDSKRKKKQRREGEGGRECERAVKRPSGSSGWRAGSREELKMAMLAGEDGEDGTE